YEFFAVIFDAAGNSSAYPVKTARTLKPVADTQAPTAGTYSSITSTANSITLNWTRGSDNVTPTNKLKYHVRYETKANYDDGGQLYGTTRKTDITTETITGLKPDTEYYVEVRVEDEAGKFTDYGSRFIRTKPATIAVTGVTLSPASLSLEVGQTGGL
ncbi:fibronectin type III domain-containing protein, partial [Tannerella forsythia]